MQQITNSTPVIATVIIGLLILLTAGFVMNGNQNTALEEIRNDINSIEIPVPTAAASGDIVVDTSGFDDQFADLCSQTDGCGGWWDVKNSDREDAVNRVVGELTENDNRDLYRAIRDLINLDDEDDIDDVEVHRIGEVRQNEDPDYDASEDKVITTDFILEVTYFEDGDNDDDKTKYFRVLGTLDDLEDGIDDGDVSVTSVEKVRKDFALP